MSRNQRIALVVVALAVAIVAFVVARPGDDEESAPSSSTTPAETQAQTAPEPETEAEPAPPPKPKVTRIQVNGGEVVGGAKTIEAAKGDVVRIVIRSDAPDEFHLHGYDIERGADPGQPARFSFTANAEGEFELGSHTAEDAGKEPVVARLLIGPS